MKRGHQIVKRIEIIVPLAFAAACAAWLGFSGYVEF